MRYVFSKFHPIVNLIYFSVVIVISMVVMHPVFVAISVFSAFLYSVILKGFSSLKFSLGVIVPMAVLSVIINILTNRNGVTLLTTLPFGISVSREALVAGLCTAGVIASAVLWFTCFNAVFTNDKLVYIFGGIMPSLSVILSMVLRFVPQFKSQF
ncbi:MAG: energy-coupling factor transporter transmembrane protein EcfT, partial [Clostridia bacterium]|nr:energy-coupling factor transporter transmembrane protein EcfT [Clostridia bacterium]